MIYLVDDSLHSYLQLFFIARTFAYKLFFFCVSFSPSFRYCVSTRFEFAVCIHIMLFEYVLNMHQFPIDTILIWFRTVVVFIPISYSYILHAGCRTREKVFFLFYLFISLCLTMVVLLKSYERDCNRFCVYCSHNDSLDRGYLHVTFRMVNNK